MSVAGSRREKEESIRYDIIPVYSAALYDAGALGDGAPDARRHPRQRLDGRAQRHRHLRGDPCDEASPRHRHGGGVQLSRRARHDAVVTESGGNDI